MSERGEQGKDQEPFPEAVEQQLKQIRDFQTSLYPQIDEFLRRHIPVSADETLTDASKLTSPPAPMTTWIETLHSMVDTFQPFDRYLAADQNLGVEFRHDVAQISGGFFLCEILRNRDKYTERFANYSSMLGGVFRDERRTVGDEYA